MRLGHVQQSRLHYIDRNPVLIHRGFLQGSVGPHASTDRWNYTVPAGRKAQVTAINILAVRSSAATTVGSIIVTIRVTDPQANNFDLLRVEFIDNTVGKPFTETIPISFFLDSGFSIRAISADGSVGGAATYNIAMQAVEFDA